MNWAYAPQVTGVVSMKNGATGTVCAGRSLSSAHGSVEVPMVNGPPGTRTSGGSRNASAGAGPGDGAASTGAPGPDLVSDQHRLVVLHLVLGDHPEREPSAEQLRAPVLQDPVLQDPVLQNPVLQDPVLQDTEPSAVQQVEDPAAHLVAVGSRPRRRQQRQLRPLGAGMLERVVQRVDFRVHRLAPADLTQQPQFFLVGDVRQIPDQRGHQRRVLRGQVGVVHAVGEQRRPLPRGGQFPGDQAAEGLGVEL